MKFFRSFVLILILFSTAYVFAGTNDNGNKKPNKVILLKYAVQVPADFFKIMSHADRRSMVISGNKIRTRIANFGSIGGPRAFNRPKIEWPAFSGRDYGYEFGPVVGARILNTLGDSVSLTEDGIQDGGSDKFEPDGRYLNTANSNAFATSNDATTWPPDWTQWLSDSVYAQPGQVLSDLETMYVMSDQDSTGNFGNVNPLEKLTPNMKGLGVQVTARTYQYSNALAQNILFLTYELKNINTKPIPNAFFGFFSDGSVGGSDNFENNTTRTDLINSGIIYTFATNGHGSQTIPEWQGVTPGWLGEVVLQTPTDDNGKELGITSCYVVHYGNLLNIQDSLVYQQAMTPRKPVSNLAPSNSYDGDSIWWLTSGPFTLNPGQTKRFEMAIVLGSDSTNLMRNIAGARLIKAANYQSAKAPTAPILHAAAGDKQVTLYWDDRAESSVDPLTGAHDFEGYKIYRSTDGVNWGQPITDLNGNPVLVRPLAQFDKVDSYQGAFPLDINGLRPTDPGFDGVHFYLGDNSGLVHQYVDNTVTDGVTYYYLVTAYTTGDTTLRLPPIENGLSISNLENPTDPNAVKITPDAPPTGLAYGSFSLNKTGGVSTVIPNVSVIDPFRLTGDTYNLSFLYDSTGTKLAVITDSNTGKVLVSGTDFSGGKEIFADGLSYVINDVSQISPIDSLTGWRVGSSTYQVNASLYTQNPRIKSSRVPADYEIRFFDTVQDTDIVFHRPVKFQCWDITNNIRVKPILLTSQYNVDTLYAGSTIVFAYSHDGKSIDSTSWQVVFTQPSNLAPVPPKAGDIARITISKPLVPGKDLYSISTVKTTSAPKTPSSVLDNIRVVPNPYIVAADWETGSTVFSGTRGEKIIKFTHLPAVCTIRIYTVNGELVQTIDHSSISDGSENWNLISKDGIEVAYGIYIYQIDAPGIGTKIGKFAIIK